MMRGHMVMIGNNYFSWERRL